MRIYKREFNKSKSFRQLHLLCGYYESMCISFHLLRVLVLCGYISVSSTNQHRSVDCVVTIRSSQSPRRSNGILVQLTISF